MRTYLLASMVLVGAAACGDDGGSPAVDAAPTGDATTVDAPPSANCDVLSSYSGLDIGTTAAPMDGNWFVRPTMGPVAGRTIFAVYGALSSSTQGSVDYYEVDVLKPAGAAAEFTTGTPIAFGQNAVFVVLANLASASADPTQVYLASGGSITINEIGEDEDDLINGSVTAANLVQVDPQTNMPIANGCTTATASFEFHLRQKPASTAPRNETRDFSRATVLSAE